MYRGQARIQVSTTCRAADDVEICPERPGNPSGELQMLTLQVKYLNLSEGVYRNSSVFTSAEHLSSSLNQQELENHLVDTI